jgi:hypothetical protein
MKSRVTLIILLLLVSGNLFGQLETYFYKIQALATKVHIDTELYKKIDSLKQTRRPTDSYISVLFNRDVDFGYKHKRIQIVFNSYYKYQINLLIKNDTIRLSSTTISFFGTSGPDDDYFNKKHSIPFIDSVSVLNYLKLRNRFYNSAKSSNDLKNELDLNEIYALRDGDGYNETSSKMHIDTLVRQKNITELEGMLKSFNCEIQEYGVLGFFLLRKNKVKTSSQDQKIIDYIKKRNSDMESMSGDLGPIIGKAYK